MEKLTILAVDDNAINLAAVEQALQDEYEVLPMIAGARAIKYLSRRTADLMLLDVKMPEMDGVQTLREIRGMENGRNLPVIFLSATNDDDAAQEGRRLGVMDYVLKPIDGTDLKRRISRVLDETGRQAP